VSIKGPWLGLCALCATVRTHARKHKHRRRGQRGRIDTHGTANALTRATKRTQQKHGERTCARTAPSTHVQTHNGPNTSLIHKTHPQEHEPRQRFPTVPNKNRVGGTSRKAMKYLFCRILNDRAPRAQLQYELFHKKPLRETQTLEMPQNGLSSSAL